MAQNSTITGRPTGTQQGNGLAIASVVLGVIDLVVFVVLLVVAANNGGSFSWHVG